MVGYEGATYSALRGHMEIILSTVADLAGYNVGPGVVGHSAYVAANDSWYEAMFEGRGLDKWELRKVAGVSVAGAGLHSYYRLFDWENTDLEVAALFKVITFGSPLPAGAIVLSVIADITEDWGDGGAGTFGADVGVLSGDDDLFTPTELDIDSGAALQIQNLFIPAGGIQLAVRFFGSANLSTLTSGTMGLTVVYAVPVVATIAAP